MKTNILFILFLVVQPLSKSNCQGLENDLIDVITKNIICFHIRYSLNFDLGLKSNSVLENERYFFTRMWPDQGYKLSIKVDNSELVYPDNNFKIYELIKIGFQMHNDSIGKSWVSNSFLADDNYLVAFNALDRKLKFLCGNYFLSSISSDFKLIEKQPNSFISYLKIRANHWKPEYIQFYKYKKRSILFTAHSNLVNREILISVNRNDFDVVEINLKEKYIIK